MLDFVSAFEISEILEYYVPAAVVAHVVLTDQCMNAR